MRVFLLYPNQIGLSRLHAAHKYTGIYQKNETNLQTGMLYIVSAIKDYCDLKYFDNSLKKLPTRKMFEEIVKWKPDIVGFGGTLAEWEEAKTISALLKVLNIKTVYGGPNATVNFKKHKKYFDVVVSGRGEDAMLKLLGIEGLNINNDFELLPDRTVIDMKQYSRSYRELTNIDTLITSLGCPYDCTFCAAKYVWNQKVSFKSIEKIEEEICDMIEKYRTKAIHVRDDNMTVSKKRFIQLAELFKKYNLPWRGQARVDFINQETVSIMKDTGCFLINCGFESINESTLKYIKKGYGAQKVVDAIELFEKNELQWSGGFMVGVLNETKKEMKAVMQFVLDVSKYKYSDTSNHPMRFVGYPVSDNYKEIKDKGLVAYDWNDGELLIPNTFHYSAKKVEEIIRKFRREHK